MSTAILGLLFKAGKGLFSFFRQKKQDKQKAAQMQAILKKFEENNPRQYIADLEKFYNEQRADTRRDINNIFNEQGKRLRQAIQQRRIPEYLAGVQKLSKVQADAISSAMRAIDQAETGAKITLSQQGVEQAFGLAQSLPVLQQIYGSTGGFGKTLRSSLQPISDSLEKVTNRNLQQWFESLNKRTPAETISGGFAAATAEGAALTGADPLKDITKAFE